MCACVTVVLDLQLSCCVIMCVQYVGRCHTCLHGCPLPVLVSVCMRGVYRPGPAAKHAYFLIKVYAVSAVSRQTADLIPDLRGGPLLPSEASLTFASHTYSLFGGTPGLNDNK